MPAPPPEPPPVVTLPDGTSIEARMTTSPKEVTGGEGFSFVPEAVRGKFFPTGVSGEGEGARMGQRVIDLAATAKALADARAPQAEPGEDLKGDLDRRAKAYFQARQDVAKWYETSQGKSSGIPMLDLGPGQTGLERWMEGGQSANAVLDAIPVGLRQAVGPLAGSTMGTALTVRGPGGTKTYNEGWGWGALDWGGRLSLFTLMSNYLATPGETEWGGKEHMENVARGEDYFTLFDKLEALSESDNASLARLQMSPVPGVAPGRKALGWTLRGASAVAASPLEKLDRDLELLGVDLVSDEGVEKTGDFIMAAGLALVDPDIWMGAGKAGRLAGKGASKVLAYSNKLKGLAYHQAAKQVRAAINAFDQSDKGAEAIGAAKVAIDQALGSWEQAVGAGGRRVVNAYAASMLAGQGSASDATAAALEAMGKAVAGRQKAMDQLRLSRKALYDMRDWLRSAPPLKKVQQTLANSQNQLDKLETAAQNQWDRIQRARETASTLEAAGDVKAAATATKMADSLEVARKTLLKARRAARAQVAKQKDQERMLREARALKNSTSIPPRLQAMMDYNVGAARYVAAVAAHADLKAFTKSVRLLAQSRSKPMSDAALKALKSKVRQGVKAVLNAQDEAEQVLALQELRDIQVEAAEQGGRYVLDMLERQEKVLAKAVAKAGKDHDAVLKAGVQQGFFTRDSIGYNKNLAAAAAMGNYAKSSVGNRAHMGLAVALQRMGDAYIQAAEKGAKSLTGADKALYSAANKMNLEHLDAAGFGTRQVVKSLEALRRFVDPLKEVAKTANVDVQQALKGAVNVVQLGRREMMGIAKAANEDARKMAEQIGPRHAWPDPYNHPAVKSLRARRYTAYLDENADDTFLQSSTDMSLWMEAMPTLRQLAHSVPDSDIIKALGRMWIPAKEDLTDLQVARLEKAAAQYLVNNPGKTFREFQEYMLDTTVLGTQKTKAAFGWDRARLRGDADRSVALAAQAVLAAVGLDRAKRDLSRLVDYLPPRTAAAAAAVADKDPRRAAEHFEAAMSMMDDLGMPPFIGKQAQDIGKDLSKGLALLGDPKNPHRHFMPRRWMDHVSSKIDRVVKQGDMYNTLEADPLRAALGDKGMAFLRLYNAGMLAGVVMLNPGYFVNILFGNNGQIYSDIGLGAAARHSVRSVYDVGAEASDLLGRATKNIPMFGEAIYNRASHLKGGLPSALGTMVSPTVTKFLDPSKGKPDDVIRAAGGTRTYTYREMRKLAIKYGVMDTFIGQSGVRDMASRSIKQTRLQRTGAWIDSWTDQWHQMAEHIERRQRIGLYIDLVVNEGADPKKAAKQVQSALYDWDHPMSQIEEQYVKKVFMFYTFQRKALGQTLRHILTGGGGYHNPMTRAIRLERLHKGTRDMAGQHLEEQYPPDPYNYPTWVKEAHMRTYGGKRPLSQKQREYWKENWGKKATHVVYSLPAPTSRGNFQQLSLGLEALAALATLRPGEALSPTVDATSMMLGPVGEAAARGVKTEMGLERPRFVGKQVNGRLMTQVSSPTERGVMHMAELLMPGQQVIQEGNLMYIDPAAHYTYRTMLPVFSVNLARWLDPVMTAEQANDKASYLMRQWSGVLKENPYKAKKGPIEE